MAGNGDAITTKFKVDISDLKRGISEANKQMKLANAEFKAASSGLDNWSKSSDGISAKLKQLESVLASQNSKLLAYQQQQARLDEGYEKNKERADQLKAALEQLAEQGVSRTSDEYKTLERALNDVEKEQNANKSASDDLKATILNQQAAINATNRDIDRWTENLSQVESEQRQAESATGKLTSEIEDQQSELAKLKQKYKDVILAEGDNSESARELAGDIEALSNDLRTNQQRLESAEQAADGLDRSIDNASESARESSGGFTVMKGALANLVADGIRKAADAIKDFAGDMIDAAATVKAQNSQFSQTFRDLEQTASDAISKIANETGILETRLQATGAGIFAFARSSGASTEEAMELMQDSLKATADSAAYYDRSLEDSAETLQSFLKGNFANDAALGVSATEFTRNAKATELFGKKYNELSEIQKQKTLLKMVTDSQKLSGAMGQAAREADGWENVQGNLNETWFQFKASVGTSFLEALIPVIQDITQKFKDWQASVDWDAFGTKVKSAIEVIINAIKFLIEHFTTIITVVGSAVIAFNTLNAAMAITGTITAARTAIAGLTTGVGLVTKAQTLWNVAMTANPIGAVTKAVGLLALGIGAVVVAIKKHKTAEDEELESANKQLKALKDEAQAYHDLKDAQAEQATNDVVGIAHAQQLKDELTSLADASGKVQEKDRERANFILNELNNALGTEYSMTGNQINGYKDLQKEIDKTIEKKKAEILLAANEQVYTEALQKRNEAQNKSAQLAQELYEAEAEVEKKREALAKKRKDYYSANSVAEKEMYSQEITDLEKSLEKNEKVLSKKEKAYKTNETTLQEYYSDISDYEEASSLILAGKSKEAVKILENKNSAYDKATKIVGDNAEAQKKILEKQVVDTEVNAKLMEDRYNAGVKGVTKEMVKTAREQADTAKEQFYDIGGNITKGIAKGAKDNEWHLSNTMQGLVNNAAAVARKVGIIQSPSRLFARDVGQWIAKGIAKGITDHSSSVNTAIKKLIKSSASNAKSTFEKSGYEKVATSMISKTEANIDKLVENATDGAKKVVNKNLSAYKKQVKQETKELTDAYKTKKKAIQDNDKLDEKQKKAQIEKLEKSIKAQKEKLQQNVENFKQAGEASVKAYTSALSDFASTAKTIISEAMTEVNAEFTEKYQKLQTAQQNLNNKMYNIGGLFSMNANGTMHMEDLKAQTQAITKYAGDLQKIKGKVSSELFEEIANMSVEDAEKYMSKLFAMSDKELKAYNSLYTQKLNAAKSLSEKIYQKDLTDLNKQYNAAVDKALKGVSKELTSAGKDAMKGFIKGMKSEKENMSGAIKTIANELVAKFKKQLKIKSPSRVFANEVGQFIPSGIALGIKDNAKALMNSVKSLTNQAVGLSQEMLSGVQVPALAGAGGSTTTTSIVNNYTQNINAPKQPSRIELYRQTKNLLNTKGGV